MRRTPVIALPRDFVARKVTGCAFLTCPSRSPTPALILTSLEG